MKKKKERERKKKALKRNEERQKEVFFLSCRMLAGITRTAKLHLFEISGNIIFIGSSFSLTASHEMLLNVGETILLGWQKRFFSLMIERYDDGF